MMCQQQHTASPEADQAVAARDFALAAFLLEDPQVVRALAELRIEAVLRRAPRVAVARPGMMCMLGSECSGVAAFVVADDWENGEASLCSTHLAEAFQAGVFA